MKVLKVVPETTREIPSYVPWRKSVRDLLSYDTVSEVVVRHHDGTENTYRAG